jgi:hypothetical protein
VDEPVENPWTNRWTKHCFLGRTARVLWMNCGWLKNLEIRDRNLLCAPHRRRRTALTTGDGYRPGGDLGDVGRVGKPALTAGIRDRWQVRECQAAEQSVRGGCRAGRGPSISYMEGPPPILPEGHRGDRYRHAEDCSGQAPGEPGRNAVLRRKYPAIRLPTQTWRSVLLPNPAGRCWLMRPLLVYPLAGTAGCSGRWVF